MWYNIVIPHFQHFIMANDLREKYGLFLFEKSPWHDSEENLIIGHTCWVLEIKDGAGPYEKSKQVTVRWPMEYFSNYLRVARRLEGENSVLEATLLYTSNGKFSAT